MTRIRIVFPQLELAARLNDSATARLIAQALPIESSARVWGREVYFDIPVDAPEEDPQAAVPSGTLAYWPPGKALCLFFGQTPYSPVNIVGELEDDPQLLAAVPEGTAVRVEPA